MSALGHSAATPAGSPPAIVPAISTAPIEIYQRIAALPSSGAMVTRKMAFEKREHAYVFTFKSAGRLDFDEASACGAEAAGFAAAPCHAIQRLVSEGRHVADLHCLLRRAAGCLRRRVR